MSIDRFVKGLIITVITVALCLFGLHQWPAFRPFWQLSLGGLLLFTALAVALYLIARRFAQSANPYIFTHLIIYNLALKILLSFLILVVYHKFAHPKTDYFIVLFGLIYLGFTVFETYFMSKLARLKSASKSTDV